MSIAEDIQARDRVLAGDEDAFSEIVRGNQGRVRACLGRYIRESATVDDLAQDVFVAAYGSLAKYHGEAAMSTWLMGIARNRALMHLRQMARHPEQRADHLDEALAWWQIEACEAENSQGDQRLEKQIKALKNCMSQLSGRKRQAIRHHYFEGKDTETVARSLDMKGAALRVMLLRIRGSLRTCIENALQTALA